MKVIEAIRSWPWARLAACRDTSVDFYIEGKSRAVMREIERAKALCATCPMRLSCLEAGLEERYGIWGATTPRERRRLRSERHQSRPEERQAA